MAVRLARLAVIVMLALVGSLTVAHAAWAHGDDEATEGYALVQQALGHLAHGTGATEIDLAMEKVQDALETDDHEGVDVAEVQRGLAALEARHVVQARSLLQDSIQEAVQSLPPATGNETGTTVVTLEFAGGSDLGALEWLLLGASTIVLLVGVWLTVLFRPPEPIRVLRARLAPADGWSADEPGADEEGG